MRRAETLEGQSKFWCSQASAEGLTDVIDYLKMKGTRRVASLIRGHLASFPSREKVLRKPRPFDEYVEWEEVRVRCCTSLLLLFAGYADYSFQPNATGRYYLEEEKIFQAKLAEPVFDRAYAVSASNGRRLAQPFRPNWYGHEFVGQSHEHYWVDAYTRYYESLFNLRASRPVPRLHPHGRTGYRGRSARRSLKNGNSSKANFRRFGNYGIMSAEEIK